MIAPKMVDFDSLYHILAQTKYSTKQQDDPNLKILQTLLLIFKFLVRH